MPFKTGSDCPCLVYPKIFLHGKYFCPFKEIRAKREHYFHETEPDKIKAAAIFGERGGCAMRSDERLLELIGNIPDEMLDEALNVKRICRSASGGSGRSIGG